MDQSGLEEVPSPDEAYLWMLEHSYSLNDFDTSDPPNLDGKEDGSLESTQG